MILAYKEGAKVMLRSRNDHDRTATFAGVARAVGQLQDRSVLLDGEVVAFDSKGVSRFQLLQRGDVAQSFAVLDCLYRNGRDLRSEPLLHRRRELEAAIEDPEQLFLARRLAKKWPFRFLGLRDDKRPSSAYCRKAYEVIVNAAESRHQYGAVDGTSGPTRQGAEVCSTFLWSSNYESASAADTQVESPDEHCAPDTNVELTSQ
jgi:hypothetical protein